MAALLAEVFGDDAEQDLGLLTAWLRRPDCRALYLKVGSKDLGICMAEAKRNGAHLPVTALVDQFYSEVQSMGGKRWDTSSLIARLNR